MLITWEETPASSSVHGIIALLSRPDWSASPHAATLEDAAARLTDDPDDTVRMLAAPALPLRFPGAPGLRDELTRRLLRETAPAVRGQLLAVAFSALAAHPDYIDDILSRLAASGSWPMLSPGPEPAQPEDQAEPAAGGDLTGPRDLHAEAPAIANDTVIQYLLGLSIVCEQPFATRLLRTWLSAPADHPARAGRTCVWLRPYLNGAATGVTSAQAERAFQLLALPVPQAASVWDAALAAGTAGADGGAARLRAVIKVSEAIGRELYFASGAAVAGAGAGTPAPAFFAGRAFPVLEALTTIPHPAVIDRVIATLSHLAGHDPRRAFIAIANAATTGHGYEWEPQGADLIVKIIDRYAADHRGLLLGDPECLSALRRLLESFVRSGWDLAIDRVQSLSEFLY
jgi:hypothetical protein